ncbi:PREDICTED: enteropeptidase-like, partial [Branchiostoma belcheri]|uniref:Enteropeptidase-like n=1 Tax=Branchiostoma belcheri TaxID=7741 RepID=A0A6P4ZYE8_BRABE
SGNGCLCTSQYEGRCCDVDKPLGVGVGRSTRCGGTLSTPSGGPVTSPNYPSNYGNNENCQWLITAPAGSTISLTFDSFDLESNYDYLTIFDGPSDSAAQLLRLSGSPVNPATTSTSNMMFIKFTSNWHVTRRGFSFYYTSSVFNCDFELGLCGWRQAHDDNFDWIRHSGSTPSDDTGPSADHTTGSGYYIYIETSSGSSGSVARVISPLVTTTSAKCVQFWYHMYGRDVNRLRVYMKTGSSLGNPVWTRTGAQGNQWRSGQVDIPAGISFND